MKGIHHNYGFPSDFPSEFSDFSPQNHQFSQMGGSNQSSASDISTQQHNSWHDNPLGTIIGRIGSPAAAFNATEIAMGLSQYDFSETSKNPYPRTKAFNQCGNGVFTESPARFKAELHPPQYIRSEGPYRNQFFSNLSEREQILHLKNKLLGDLDDSNRQSPLSFSSNQDLEVSFFFKILHFFNFFPCDQFLIILYMFLHTNLGLTQSICTKSRATKELRKA